MSQNATTNLPVLIIGAGIAGLTLAQGLRLHSIPFRLFERHPRSRRLQGHRFRISKDGQTALNSVLSPQLQGLVQQTEPDRFAFAPRYVNTLELDFAKLTPVDPLESMPVDRSWIRMLATLDLDDAVEYEKEFESYSIVEDGKVQVRFTDGSEARGQLLVGADGIRSRVRKQLQPDRKLLDLERWVLWGRTPITEELKRNVPEDVLTWCMFVDPEANVQVVAEPMVWSKSVSRESDNRLPDFTNYIYWVVCTASSQEPLPKTAEERSLFLKKVTERWHPALKVVFDSATHDLSACVNVLSSKPDIEIRAAGQTGRVTLIGDAAHAMSPMGGAGGDTAIRTAAHLAHAIGRESITESSIAEFETRMEELAKEKIEHSFRGGQRFWRGKEWTEYSEIDV
ncbi:FAD/NAD(P)-binding domain-containing protein [Hypoxylon sp. NC1633]|nr:FAD/NAD(P)-binding domain-containing protein [Hypoxylon sp. NC1633]